MASKEISYNFRRVNGGPDSSLPWVRRYWENSGGACPSRSPHTNEGEQWRCTLQAGHSGKHLGGYDDTYWGAEWETIHPDLMFPEGV